LDAHLRRRCGLASFNNRTYNAEGESEYTTEHGTTKEVWRLQADIDNPTPLTNDDIEAATIQILGSTRYEVSTNLPGLLERIMPIASAQEPDQTAYNVKIKPVKYTKDYARIPANINNDIIIGTLDSYTLWDEYDFLISFATPPYQIIPDDFIINNAFNFTAFTDSGVPYGGTFYPEWLRFTVLSPEPREEILKAKGVLMKLRGATSPTGKPLPQYAGLATMPLNSELLAVEWYNVPYRYVLSPNSFLRLHRFKVNQLPFLGRAPGQLLYKGYRILKQYAPPFANLTHGLGGVVIPAATKLVNLRLEFLATDRVATNPPEVANPNWIVNGWNALPYWWDRKYYYSTVDVPNPANQFPSWFSFPHQLLWQDPDGPLGGVP
jgi:hypothetical protein